MALKSGEFFIIHRHLLRHPHHHIYQLPHHHLLKDGREGEEEKSNVTEGASAAWCNFWPHCPHAELIQDGDDDGDGDDDDDDGDGGDDDDESDIIQDQNNQSNHL